MSNPEYNWEQEYQKVEKKGWFARFWWLVLILVAIIGICVICAGSFLKSDGSASRSIGEVPNDTVASQNVSRTKAGLSTSFSDGMWIVNADIKPGTYKAIVPKDSYGCYWARQANTSDPLTQIIANGTQMKPGAQVVVTITKKDWTFETMGCGTWGPA